MTASETKSEKYSHILKSENWKETSYKPIPDEIIEAYEEGKKAGLSQSKKIILHKFEDNLRLATQLSQKLFNDLNESISPKFCKDIFLKIEGISEFEALFIVDNKSYITDLRNKAFNIARMVKKENKSDVFVINFSFLPDSQQIDTQNIFYDGYALKYEPKKRTKTRKS